MIRGLWERLLDEFVAWQLLRLIFGYRDHPPRALEREFFPAGLFSGNREEFFQPRPVPRQFAYQAAESHPVEGLRERTFRFRSSVETPFPEAQAVVCSEWTATSGSSDRVVVGVDGIVQIGQRSYRRLAERLVPNGWSVVALDAPYNHRRTPDGYRPGQLIANGNLAHQLNVARQSILDLWTLVISLQSQGKRVGLVGISYGAWMTTLTSQLVDDLLFLHAITPPLEMAWILREGGAIVRAFYRGLQGELPAWDEVVRLSRPISPYYGIPRIPRERIFIHTARYDRFVPTGRMRAYAKMIGVEPIEHPVGHINATCRLSMVDRIARMIDAMPVT